MFEHARLSSLGDKLREKAELSNEELKEFTKNLKETSNPKGRGKTKKSK